MLKSSSISSSWRHGNGAKAQKRNSAPSFGQVISFLTRLAGILLPLRSAVKFLLTTDLGREQGQELWIQSAVST